MALRKSMLVARADLRMAMKVKMVKYGLIIMSAMAPIMLIGLVLLLALSAPAVAAPVIAMLDPMISPVIGIMVIVPASMISANALVGEKEQNTLEPLLCTPLTDRELLIGKVLSSFIPTITLLLGSVIVTEIATNIILTSVGAEVILFPGVSSLFLLLVAGPILIAAVVSVMVLISGKVKRVYEAYQSSGVVVMVFLIPLILPMLSMNSGGTADISLVWLSNIFTLLFASVLAIVTWTLAIRRFNRDRIVSM
ncbi:MAG: ABC transporter permease subunit [Candidatus Thorarchaeota archaeon]|nr:MAG: ABC transporter permease subunit [Candidatus Thorarchaeota archaeon]